MNVQYIIIQVVSAKFVLNKIDLLLNTGGKK